MIRGGGSGVGRSRRAGIVLPVALLLLLGASLMAAALLLMARSAVLLSDGDRRLAEALARRPPPASDRASGELPLPHGFVLRSDAVTGVAWQVWDLAWRPDASRLAAALRAVAETGDGVVDAGGVLQAEGPAEGCPDDPPLPLHRTAVQPPLPDPDPSLPPFPRLGPVGLSHLQARAGSSLASGEPLPGGADLVYVSDGGAVRDGELAGLLVAGGDLRLEGEAGVEGLVLVAGDLDLEGSARVRGAVRVGGLLRLGPGSALAGCRSVVAAALADLPALETPFSVPGGEFLGRY